MSAVDIILAAILIAALVPAIRRTYKTRKSGGCSCCGGGCPGCEKMKNE